MDFGKAIEAYHRIEEALKGLNDMEAKPIVCMVIDLIAAKSNQTSIELMDELRPLIEMVNNKLGTIEI